MNTMKKKIGNAKVVKIKLLKNIVRSIRMIPTPSILGKKGDICTGNIWFKGNILVQTEETKAWGRYGVVLKKEEYIILEEENYNDEKS